MADEPQRFSLSRWSRRKLDAKRAPGAGPEALQTADAAPPGVPAEPVTPPPAAVDELPAPAAAREPEPPLPPVESLSMDSDFRPFMAPRVDEATKRAALRKLFSDPHFNVMDGLDVYIDDYNKPDPMPEGMLEKIVGVYDRLAAESAAQEAAEKAAAAELATTGEPPAPAPTVGADASPPTEAIAGAAAVAVEPIPEADRARTPPPPPTQA